jgi:hypothetical protein
MAVEVKRFGIPEVTIAPHSINGFNWGSVVRPMNDACVEQIEVDPSNTAPTSPTSCTRRSPIVSTSRATAAAPGR